MGWSFLSDEDEEQIANCIRDFQAAGFPLTMSRVRSLAWQYANLNGIPGFSQDNQKANRGWGIYFLKRHPDLWIRHAVNLSIAWAMSGNEPNVAKWFREYKQVLHDLHIVSPEQIWSGDEMVYRTYPKRGKLLLLPRNHVFQLWGLRRVKPQVY